MLRLLLLKLTEFLYFPFFTSLDFDECSDSVFEFADCDFECFDLEHLHK